MSAVDDGPSYEEAPYKVPPTTYIRVGPCLKQLAIIELNTGEPIQFITRSPNTPQFQLYLNRLCARWDDYFDGAIKKKWG